MLTTRDVFMSGPYMMAAPRNDVDALDSGLRSSRQPVAQHGGCGVSDVLLLVALALFEWRAHLAALAGWSPRCGVMLVYGMPLPTATATARYGAAYGFLP